MRYISALWGNVKVAKQQQANWNQTDNTKPDFIKNKPDVSFPRLVEIKVLRDTDILVAGDAKATFTIPIELNGFKLTRAEAAIKTASTSGLVNLQIRNATTGQDMLSTAITIDQSELNSYSAATPSAVNAAANTVSTANMIAIDVDYAGVGSKGLDVMLTFEM